MLKLDIFEAPQKHTDNYESKNFSTNFFVVGVFDLVPIFSTCDEKQYDVDDLCQLNEF